MVFCVTGATGFVGLALCKALISSGHRVIAVARRSHEVLEELASTGLLIIHRSDLQHLVLSSTDLRADVFIHLAWMGTQRKDRNDPIVQAENIPVSISLIGLAWKMGCHLYVDAGSQAEYGIVRDRITEETPCQPVTAYGKAKFKLYRESLEECSRMCMKYLHLRLFSIFGPGDHPDSLIMTALRALRAGEPFTLRTGEQAWNYLYVADAARIIMILCEAAIQNPCFQAEVFHVASEDTRPLRDFVKAMKDTLSSESVLHFGTHISPETVSLDPAMDKTRSIVVPFYLVPFEDAIHLL